MMLKILQASTVGIFVLITVAGVLILFFANDKLDGYLSLVGYLAPLFIAEVIPAFLGKPLKEYVATLKLKATKVNNTVNIGDEV